MWLEDGWWGREQPSKLPRYKLYLRQNLLEWKVAIRARKISIEALLGPGVRIGMAKKGEGGGGGWYPSTCFRPRAFCPARRGYGTWAEILTPG
jgi:hypothetical protein